MNLLQQFVDFLSNHKPKRSWLTVKNYKADIGQFINWFEKEFKLPFDGTKITSQIIEQYKKFRNLSESSLERHTSSLRKFFDFLITKEIISENALEKKIVSAEELAREDPWMIRNFKSFLYEYHKSDLTIKNYINDIKSFFVWLGEVALTKYSWNMADRNLLNKINFSVIEEYKQRLITAKFSPLTINRKLSSLRSYIAWAKNQGLIPPDHSPSHAEFISASNLATNSSAYEQEILNSPKGTFLSGGGAIQNDKEKYSSFPPTRLMQKTLKGINSLFDSLFILPLAQTVETMQYLFWKASGKKIFKKDVMSNAQIIGPERISNIKKDFYAPLNTSTRYFPFYKRLWHHVRYTRPNWYKRYHSYSFAHYLHFAILITLSCAVGFGIYDSMFADTQKNAAVLGTTASAPPKILSFQGKLTDSSGTPITKDTNILFSLYTDENASIAASLWQEKNTVKPDLNGVFSVFLGKTTSIPDTAFSQNSRLFLGITVGDGPELLPRQELATVPFASNANTLQGLGPITNTTKTSNVVLALDSSGNLSIADANPHTFQTIGGNLILSGKVLSLVTTPGSNSNVQIVPDGIGMIDLSKPIFNSTNNNNLSSAVGSVEFDDTVAILATSSSQTAFYINQTSTGGLISANTNGSAKFTVGNSGGGTFAGDLSVNGSSLNSSTPAFNLLNSAVTTLNIGGAATAINLGISGGSTVINSNLVLSSLTSNGGILYTNGSGRIYQVSAGSSSDCLTGGSTPSFTPCSNINNIFNQANGAIYSGNSTFDLLLGATATSSALIKLTGTNVAGSNNSWFNAGNVGIGTTDPGAKLDVVGGQTQIEISTQYSQRLCHNGADNSTTQSVLLGDCSAGGSDIAEYYGSKDLTIEAGDVVVAAPGAQSVNLNSKAYVNKSDSSYQGGVIGIVSTNPYDVFGKNFNQDEHSFPVALIGRVPVKISLENGPIKAGDLLTSSSIPGVAMKAIKAGPIVGKALEDLNVIDESKIAGFYDPESNEYWSKASLPPNIPKKPSLIPIVKIYVFANVSWYDPSAFLAQNGELVISNTSPNMYSISNSNNETLNNIGGFFEVMAANIKAGLIKASDVITNTLVVTSDSIVVNGQSLRDYIVSVIKDSGIIKSDIISPVVSTDQLSANVISPLSSPSLIVKLSTPSGSLIIENASGSAVAKIDDQGNASFSGHLSASSGQFGDASISGVLRAKSIVADSIEGLETKISSITADTILNTKYSIHNTNYADLASYSAQLSNIPDFTAQRAQFNQGLMVFGPTSLADLSIAGRLSIGGTMFVTENSIETLGVDLSLQSLKQGGLSIMGGLVYIDTLGNVKVQGDLSVSGKLAVNIISPLPTSDLVVNNASGSSVLSVNQAGDVVASGSGTFAKLNFSLIEPVLAVSATEVIASSSAGVTSIAPYQSEITINNALVTDKSVIYITPVGTPSAQTPFLMRQIPDQPASLQGGSFTVGVQSPTNHPLDFNWLIIN